MIALKRELYRGAVFHHITISPGPLPALPLCGSFPFTKIFRFPHLPRPSKPTDPFIALITLL